MAAIGAAPHLLRCIAGAAAILEPHEVMAGSQIFGGASIVDGEGGSGRIVRLTTTAQFTVVGTMVFAPPLAHTAPGAADFALDFELLCGRGTVGEGMSVSFAPLPNVPLHVDDMGMPQGWRVSISFRTGSSERVHIHFRGEQLLSARLDGGHVSQCDRYNCENCRDRLSCDLIDDVWCEWIPWQRVCRRPYFERQPPGGSPPHLTGTSSALLARRTRSCPAPARRRLRRPPYAHARRAHVCLAPFGAGLVRARDERAVARRARRAHHDPGRRPLGPCLPHGAGRDCG